MGANRRWIAAVAFALLPTSTVAQTVTQSFHALQGVLNVGETVVVTDEDGRKIKGKVAAVSDSSLDILTKETPHDAAGRESEQWTGRRTFQESSVRQIVHRDSLWNGLAIGAAAGILPAASVWRVWGCGQSNYSQNEGGCALGALFLAGGAAIGAAIDALIGGDRVFYVSPRPTRGVTVSPILSSHRQAMLATIRF